MKHVAIVHVRMRLDAFDGEDAALTAGQIVQDAGFPVLAATVSGVRYGFELDMPDRMSEAERNEALEAAPR